MAAGALLAAAMGAAPALAETAGPACDVAAAVIQQKLPADPKTVVVVGATASMPRSAIAARPLENWKSPPPSRALIQAWAAAKDQDVLDCGAVQKLLRARGVASGRAAAAAVSRRNGKPITEAYGATVLSVGMPVLAADGQEALIEVAQVCGGLCGNSSLAQFRRRRDGQWRMASALPLWFL